MHTSQISNLDGTMSTVSLVLFAVAYLIIHAGFAVSVIGVFHERFRRLHGCNVAVFGLALACVALPLQ